MKNIPLFPQEGDSPGIQITKGIILFPIMAVALSLPYLIVQKIFELLF